MNPLADVEALLRRHRTASVLGAFILLLAGVDLILNPTHLPNNEFVGIPFLVAGLAIFALVFRKAPGAPAKEDRTTLASRFLHVVTFEGRLVRWFPAIAIVLIGLDLGYNQLVFRGISLGTEDTTFYLSRMTFVTDSRIGMAAWRDRLFAFLTHNVRRMPGAFQIPAEQTVEIPIQLAT